MIEKPKGSDPEADDGEKIYYAMGILAIWRALIEADVITKWQALAAIEGGIRQLKELELSGAVSTDAGKYARERTERLFQYIQSLELNSTVPT